MAGLATALELGSHELVALVGGGGKTTSLFALGEQLTGTVVLTTTTKMGRERTAGHDPLFSPTDAQLSSALARLGTVLVWESDDDHKALGVEARRCDRWFDLADHVVVEADGSRRLPFKAPHEHEPVIPSRATIVVACVGAGALGQPVSERCQRPELVAALAGCDLTDLLTPERLALVLLSEKGSRKNCPVKARFVVMINQVDESHRLFVDDLVVAIAGRAALITVASFDPDPEG